jgi:hypothetical protein
LILHVIFYHFYSQSQGTPDCFAPAVQDFRADAEDELMERLPELNGLSHADKDQLIRFLWESLGELREEQMTLHSVSVDNPARLRRFVSST